MWWNFFKTTQHSYRRQQSPCSPIARLVNHHQFSVTLAKLCCLPEGSCLVINTIEKREKVDKSVLTRWNERTTHWFGWCHEWLLIADYHLPLTWLIHFGRDLIYDIDPHHKSRPIFAPTLIACSPKCRNTIRLPIETRIANSSRLVFARLSPCKTDFKYQRDDSEIKETKWDRINGAEKKKKNTQTRLTD